jgi:Sulfotransferase domain
VRVLGVGFGRTGTVSLKAALEQLGFGPCYHMQTVLDEPHRAAHWTAAAHGEPAWDATFAGFESTVEWPGAAFWRELVEHYPDAKVILSVRDPDAWSTSAQRTIFRGPTQSDRWLAAIRRRVQPEILLVHRMIGEVVVRGVFDSRVDDHAHLAATLRRHNADVVRQVQSRRLLVYDIGHGWPPLCAFLGVAVPPAPFPHANDRGAFRRKEWTDVARAAIIRARRG